MCITISGGGRFMNVFIQRSGAQLLVPPWLKYPWNGLPPIAITFHSNPQGPVSFSATYWRPKISLVSFGTIRVVDHFWSKVNWGTQIWLPCKLDYFATVGGVLYVAIAYIHLESFVDLIAKSGGTSKLPLSKMKTVKAKMVTWLSIPTFKQHMGSHTWKHSYLLLWKEPPWVCSKVIANGFAWKIISSITIN